MARTVAVGVQDFEKVVSNGYFYIDKTNFIKEWWESADEVTLITRPRRFGKTLNMNMLERFWSIKYKGRGKIFENLFIWGEEKFQKLQGTYPVISLSFAGVKEDNYPGAKSQINQIITNLYSEYEFLRDCGKLGEKDKAFFDRIGHGMENSDAAMSLNRLSEYLFRYYGKKVIILLDEYDTPMQEAYVNGFWKELISFIRNLFNNTFKTNPFLERAVMTGITRVSRESMYSDLNNLKVVTMISNEYASCFGFTEEEVFAAMDEFGMENREDVRKWYDGFAVGGLQDIYNPWSIINFLDQRKLGAYWANTSSNGLAGSLLRKGDKEIKMQFEQLLSGRTIESRIDEEIVYSQLEQNESAVWSLLLAAGYLQVTAAMGRNYELSLTNYEVRQMFENMVLDWFCEDAPNYNGFVHSLLQGDLKAMNAYMNRMSKSMFSSFDGGNKPSGETNPERFYHGFVLGLLVDLAGRYAVASNRESGFGRYDVLLEPLKKEDDGIILEFKVHDPDDEGDLKETVAQALKQIEDKQYEQVLLDHGVSKDRIRKYGFAFEGKKVLIGGDSV
ncbi:MAG: AAA family ATPase [Lachnospiraceae bacterium]|nr:AAA family ATPase [Lachnospiraceae bacterium]